MPIMILLLLDKDLIDTAVIIVFLFVLASVIYGDDICVIAVGY